MHTSYVQPLLHTCLRRGRLHRVVVEDNVLQLPEFPVSCRNLCDLIAGEVESDERKICQFCRNAQERLIKNKHKDRKEKKTSSTKLQAKFIVGVLELNAALPLSQNGDHCAEP